MEERSTPKKAPVQPLEERSNLKKATAPKRRSAIHRDLAAEAMARQEEVSFLFTRYDKDCSGTIDVTELSDLLSEMKFNIAGRRNRTEEQMQEWFKRELSKVDTNNDGVLSFDEFVVFYNKYIASLHEMNMLYAQSGEILGKGAFGVVRKGKRKEDGLGVAIKNIDKAGAKLNLLKNEVHIWSRMQHPHLLQLLDVFESQGTLQLVTELAAGGDLFDRLCSVESFSEEQAAELTSQIVSAVEYLHANKIVHCDLKPQNILVLEPPADDTRMHVKIADFGLSQIWLQADGRAGSVTDEDKGACMKFTDVCGTPNYFAPELVALAQGHVMVTSYDAAVDCWALGCIIFEMLTGEPPFTAADESVLFYKITDNHIDFPKSERDGIRAGSDRSGIGTARDGIRAGWDPRGLGSARVGIRAGWDPRLPGPEQWPLRMHQGRDPNVLCCWLG